MGWDWGSFLAGVVVGGVATLAAGAVLLVAFKERAAYMAAEWLGREVMEKALSDVGRE